MAIPSRSRRGPGARPQPLVDTGVVPVAHIAPAPQRALEPVGAEAAENAHSAGFGRTAVTDRVDLAGVGDPRCAVRRRVEASPAQSEVELARACATGILGVEVIQGGVDAQRQGCTASRALPSFDPASGSSGVELGGRRGHLLLLVQEIKCLIEVSTWWRTCQASA